MQGNSVIVIVCVYTKRFILKELANAVVGASKSESCITSQ
jgi:hypothetical protein